MRVLYHLTVPPSPFLSCDAVVQEVEMLRARFGGEVVHLYPGRAPGTRLPRRWWGMQRLPALRRAEGRIDLHHIFNPDPFPFFVLRFLRRPIIYTAVAGVGDSDQARRLADRVHTLVLPTEAGLERLRGWGIENSAQVRPSVDLARFSAVPPPADGPPTLLVGSAPWTRAQFRTKGVDPLLELAQGMEGLRLVFLWRGVLAEEMAQRVRDAGLEERVEVLNQQVDVTRVLARVHAAVALAADGSLIKAYPHSLLEALAAGRPVLVSRSIPMAAYVEREGCGVVVERMDVPSLETALKRLLRDYEVYRQGALAVGLQEFAPERLLNAYGRMYDAARRAGGENL